MINTKMLGMLVAAFAAGSFVASPELRAYAANTIGSADIINESILSADIKNGEVKAADIATDAVTADEIKGVSKLLFGQCKTDSTTGTISIPPGAALPVTCSINGVDADDSAIAVKNSGNACTEPVYVYTQVNAVLINVKNDCTNSITIGTGTEFSVMVFDK